MSPDSTNVIIREIDSVQDPAWEGWKSIYYDSFPENERMTEAYLLRVLEKKAAGSAPDSHMLAMLPRNEREHVTGLAYYEADQELRAGFLWYLAMRQGHRSRGYGAIFYSDLLRRLKAGDATILLFEVEIPELAREEGAERGEMAERRIGWYRRQGALLLDGVQYFQSVDAPVDPTEMYVMAHPFVPMTAEQVFAVASNLFDDAIKQTGPLALR
jgi:hypothetical protein